ncbi:MAG: aminoacyl-tRNA hydrolase [Phycisphaerales bacterium]|nr:aminoacyl-tRNA hydrolase [Phycisphaerales bacterium]
MDQEASGLELAPGVYVAAMMLRFKYARSSGPGGQNVNKVSSKAELWVAVEAMTGMNFWAKQRLRKLAGARLTRSDEIHLTSDETRSQESNRQIVMQRLRDLIVEACRPPKVRKKTKPSRAARQRRLDTKKQRGQVKQLRRQMP